jgi:uncharacterized protein YndB with AHSA1/START domain
MNGTLRRVGDKYELRFERRLRHPPEKVWRAITDNAELRHWFPATMTGGHAPGDALRFEMLADAWSAADAEIRAMVEQQQGEIDPDGPHTRGTMRIWDPPRVLEYEWGGELLRFELIPDGAAATRLVFIHTYEASEQTKDVGAGWEFCFEALDARVDGRDPMPITKPRFDALSAEYAAALARAVAESR